MRLKSFPGRKEKSHFQNQFPANSQSKVRFIVFSNLCIFLRDFAKILSILSLTKIPWKLSQAACRFWVKIDGFAAGSEFTEVAVWGGGTRRWSLLGSWFAIWPGGRGRGRKYHVALDGKRGGGKEMDYRPSKKCGMLYGLKIAGWFGKITIQLQQFLSRNPNDFLWRKCVQLYFPPIFSEFHPSVFCVMQSVSLCCTLQ